MKHSILLAIHNSLGMVKTYLPHLLSTLEDRQEVLLLDLCSQDNTITYLLNDIPEIQDAIQSKRLRVFKCVGDVQVNPAQGFNALSKKANGEILSFISANQFAPTPAEIYDIVRDGTMASPKFDYKALRLGGLKVSITAKDFSNSTGFYEGYTSFYLLGFPMSGLKVHNYIDTHPVISQLPDSLGDFTDDVSRCLSLRSHGLPALNVDMGMAKIIEVGCIENDC